MKLKTFAGAFAESVDAAFTHLSSGSKISFYLHVDTSSSSALIIIVVVVSPQTCAESYGSC